VDFEYDHLDFCHSNHSRSRRRPIPASPNQIDFREINYEILDALTRGRRKFRDVVRGAAECQTREAYSIPSGSTPQFRNLNRKAEPRQVFRTSDAQVDTMASKQSPRYTPPHSQEEVAAVWIKARRGSPRNPVGQSGTYEDLWAKAMRGSSPDAQAPKKSQASQSARPLQARQCANDEVKALAGSDLEYVHAQVKTYLHHAHICIDSK
jgi:hypothetical protein